MLHLPKLIEVHVLMRDSDRPRANVLVALHLNVGGRYYYGGTLGLTDVNGTTRLRRDEVVAGFEDDQKTFPMDFKVPLSECDSIAALVIRGNGEFTELRRSVETSTLVLPRFRAMWRAAENETVESTSLPIDFGLLKSVDETMRVTIRA